MKQYSKCNKMKYWFVYRRKISISIIWFNVGLNWALICRLQYHKSINQLLVKLTSIVWQLIDSYIQFVFSFANQRIQHHSDYEIFKRITKIVLHLPTRMYKCRMYQSYSEKLRHFICSSACFSLCILNHKHIK